MTVSPDLVSDDPPGDDLGPRATVLGLAGLLVVVAVLRFVPLLAHDWALGDGGLFYAIIGDVITAGFGLPEVVSFQGGVIPFAYPPLGFYLAAAVEESLGVARSDVLRVLPATFAVASVGVMYLVAAELGPTRRHAILAAAFYGALLGLVDALVAGGGLTRSLGLLLAMTATWLGFRMCRSGQWRYVASTALVSGLALLAHPQTGPIVAVALGAAWLTRWRTRRALLQTISAGLGAILVVLPWAVVIIDRHGIEPFINAAAVPDRDLVDSLIAYLFLFLLTTPVIGLLDILGQVQQGLARRPHLPAWRAGVFLLDLRFSPVAGAAPVSMLAAHGTLDALTPAVWRLASRGRAPAERRRARFRRGVVAIVLVLAFIPTVVATADLTEPGAALTPAQREAMTWVRDETLPPTWTVSLATASWGSDDVSEWFPALSQRRSATTTQGYEWLGERHRQQHAAEAELRACRNVPDLPACLDAWLHDQLGPGPAVIYIDASVSGAEDLSTRLVSERGYAVLYRNDAGTILAPPG